MLCSLQMTNPPFADFAFNLPLGECRGTFNIKSCYYLPEQISALLMTDPRGPLLNGGLCNADGFADVQKLRQAGFNGMV